VGNRAATTCWGSMPQGSVSAARLMYSVGGDDQLRSYHKVKRDGTQRLLGTFQVFHLSQTWIQRATDRVALFSFRSETFGLVLSETVVQIGSNHGCGPDRRGGRRCDGSEGSASKLPGAARSYRRPDRLKGGRGASKNGPINRRQDDQGQLTAFEVLLIREVLVSRYHGLKVALLRSRQEIAVFQFVPAHLSRRADFMAFQVTAQRSRDVVIKQHPHGLSAGLRFTA